MSKLNKIIVWPISLIGFCIGALYNERLARLTRLLYQKFFTSFYSSRFYHFGEGILISGKITLNIPESISIDDGTKIGKASIITAWGDNKSVKINIGKRCNIGEYNHITSLSHITIGNDVLTGRWVTITDNSHGKIDLENLELPPDERQIVSKGEVTIGNKCWIGDKVTILPNVTIGDSCIIGANSVVNKSFPSYCVIGGIPAKIVRRLIN